MTILFHLSSYLSVCTCVYSRNVLLDDNQVLVKWITKHLLSINGHKDWKKKQEARTKYLVFSILIPKAAKFGWPACVCMESVALGIMAKSQPQTVLRVGEVVRCTGHSRALLCELGFT